MIPVSAWDACFQRCGTTLRAKKVTWTQLAPARSRPRDERTRSASNTATCPVGCLKFACRARNARVGVCRVLEARLAVRRREGGLDSPPKTHLHRYIRHIVLVSVSVPRHLRRHECKRAVAVSTVPAECRRSPGLQGCTGVQHAATMTVTPAIVFKATRSTVVKHSTVGDQSARVCGISSRGARTSRSRAVRVRRSAPLRAGHCERGVWATLRE